MTHRHRQSAANRPAVVVGLTGCRDRRARTFALELLSRRGPLTFSEAVDALKESGRCSWSEAVDAMGDLERAGVVTARKIAVRVVDRSGSVPKIVVFEAMHYEIARAPGGSAL